MKRTLLAGILALSMAIHMPVTVTAAEADEVNVEDNEVNEESDAPENEDDLSGSGNEENQTEDEKMQEGEEESPDLQEAEPAFVQEDELSVSQAFPELSYRVHVQTYGWQEYKKNGEAAGTTGEAKRLEAIELAIVDSQYEGGIEYRTHVQTYGWQNWVSDGKTSGTTAQAKRLEAIQIRLTGELEDHYDIYYRAHAQTYGWLGWAKNGEMAGTATYAKRLESIEIVLTEKGTQAPGDTEGAYFSPDVQYQTHVQTYGWQGAKYDGDTSGTSGQAKRLEAIKISLADSEKYGYEGGVRYRTHIQTYGWQDWASDGAVSGTTGEAKRLEAVRVELTGDLANYYSVYYRVHVQTLGWLGWAKDGESAGTEGFAKRLEAIEIRLIRKDTANAPDMSGQSYLTLIPDSDVSLFGQILGEDDSEIQAVGNGQVLGDAQGEKVLESFGISLNTGNITTPPGSLWYRAHCQSDGWKDWVEQGAYAGTSGEEKRLEAIQIQLSGNLESLYDVYYRTCVETYGWLGWTKNGNIAGTTGYSSGIKAIQVQLVSKNQKGPDTGENAYVTKTGAGILRNPCPAAFISDEFGGREAPTAGASTNHKGRDYAAAYGTEIYAASTGTVTKVDYNDIRGNYVILDHGHGLCTVYQHCSKITVKEGQSVFVGSKIAEVGSTGISTGPHLHFEVWIDKTPVDPRLYL